MALNIKKFEKIPDGYYVYLWYRVEDHHVFYVGKGKGERVRNVSKTKRNPFFMNFFEKYECDYEIIKDGLTEEEAYVLENELFQKYRQENQCECNLADTSSCNGGPSLKGELNGMFGKTHSQEVKEKLRQINSDGRNKGKNNTQYKVSPKERMTEEVYKVWKEKQYKRKIGSSNPNSHFVLMLNIITKEYKIFNATVECAKYLYDNHPEFADRYDSIEKLRYVIKHSNKTNAIYFNYQFIIFNKKDSFNIDDTVSSLVSRQIRKIPKYERD